MLLLTVLFVAVLTGTSWAQAERQLLDGKFRAGDEIVIGARIPGTVDGTIRAAVVR